MPRQSRFFRAAACAAAFCFVLSANGFLSSEAMARPEMAGQTPGDRFTAMDADKNGAISREEFFAAQPQMKDAAFDALDADKDGAISAEEWATFTVGHGKDGGPGMGEGHAPGMGMPHKDDAAKEAPSLIMPPKKSE